MNTNIEKTLQSLRDLDFMSFPNPFPPLPDLITFIEQRLARYRIEHLLLDRNALTFHHNNGEYTRMIETLELRLAELLELSPKPLPSEAPKNIPAENPAQSESTIPNQRSNGESEVNPCRIQSESAADHGESPPNPAASRFTSSESNESESESHDTDEDNDEEDQEDEDAEDENEDEPFDLSDYLDDQEIDAAVDLQEHLSGRSPLDRLKPREQQAILRLLDDEYTCEQIAQVISMPRPHGFGIKTSDASVNRFRHRCNAVKEERLKTEKAQAAQDLINKAGGSDQDFQQALERLLKTKLLLTANEPDANIGAVDTLITSLTKYRKQSLAERKQTHAEKLHPID